MKKFAILVLFTCCMTVLLALSMNVADAQAATTSYKMTSKSVTVRKKPGTSGGKLGTLKKGNVVTVSGKSGNWGKITYKKKTGWISLKKCVRVTKFTSKTNTSKTNTSNTNTSNTKISAALGSAGRLTISSIDCSVALNQGSSQDIVDAEDSAAYFTMKGCTVIADHVNQAFGNLRNVKKGSTCTIQTSSATTKYKCVKTGSAWNYTYDLIDDDGNSVLCDNQGCLIMYTCSFYSYLVGNGTWAVNYTVWKKA